MSTSDPLWLLETSDRLTEAEGLAKDAMVTVAATLGGWEPLDNDKTALQKLVSDLGTVAELIRAHP